MRKGQMEVIVVLGIVLVAIVVIFYSLDGSGIFPSPVPAGIYEQQKEVAESVKKVITDATDQTVGEVMSHGGYLEERLPGVSKAMGDVQNTGFMHKDVAFWQRCDNVMYPSLHEIEVWMAASIRKMVSEGMEDIEEQYGDRAEFDMSGLEVDVDIKGAGPYEPDVIDVTVTLPTEVRDYRLPSDLHPYKVSFKSKLGRIYAFGEDFAKASREKRFFDWFSIEAILFSQELENTHAKLPTYGVMTECGEVVYRSPDQINRYLLEMVGYVMSSVVWWVNTPNLCPGGVCLDKTLFFGIQDLGGKTYSDLEIRSMLTDDWEFRLTDYMMATNYEMPTHDVYSVPVCTASYNHAYEFTYPYVLRVMDPYTGYSFNMAYEVGVKDSGDGTMDPGDCGEPGASTECSELLCQGSVKVQDENGHGLEGAFVVFGECPVGETDQNGFASDPVKCGVHELAVYMDSEREFLRREVTSGELYNGYIVTLNPVKEVTIHFREVSIKESSDAQPIGCDACAKDCQVSTKTMTRCEIDVMGTDPALVEFDNGYIRLPVSNSNTEAMPDDCGEGDECRICNEQSGSISEDTPQDVVNNINDACRACASGCYATPLESVVVDYMPSGYTYDVSGSGSSPFEFITTGVLEDSFYLEPDVTDIYIYMAARSGDRMSYENSRLEDWETDCLMGAMRECGIEPVSTVDYSSPVIVTS